MVTYRLELVRSDMGDGGWSIHAHRVDGGGDSQREWPIVHSGESHLRAGEWTRPSQRDWSRARRIARDLAKTSQLEVAS